jgi:ribonucleoside-diphosphate reductase alpha chain
LELKFLPKEQEATPDEATGELPPRTVQAASGASDRGPAGAEVMRMPSMQSSAPIQLQTDAPPCHTCGSIMVRNGACYKCVNCGSTSGCS